MREFGREGKEDGELSQPYGVAMDTGDTMYVAEWANMSISLFTKEGQFLRSFKPLDSAPYGIALDKNGLICVAYADINMLFDFSYSTPRVII